MEAGCILCAIYIQHIRTYIYMITYITLFAKKSEPTGFFVLATWKRFFPNKEVSEPSDLAIHSQN